MPPPEPKSKTTSPGLSSARVVGFPQPREASRAASGICLIWETSYRFDVIGSQHSGLAEVAPQQVLPPTVTRVAACPYFSFTTSFMSLVPVVVIVVSYLQS